MTDREGYERQLLLWAERLQPKLRKYALLDAALVVQSAPTLAALKQLAGDSRATSRDRARAIWALGVVRPKGTSAVLMNALGDGTNNEIVLWEVAKALVKVEPRGVVRELMKHLEHGTPQQRSVAAWTIGFIGATSARAALERALARDRSVRVREHAAEALGTIGTAVSIPVLIATTKAAAPDVRFSAAYALGQIGDPIALEALQALLTDDTVTRSGQTIRAAARTAIQRIKARKGHASRSND